MLRELSIIFKNFEPAIKFYKQNEQDNKTKKTIYAFNSISIDLPISVYVRE